MADDALETKALFESLAQSTVFIRQYASFELKLNPLSQLLHLDRFCEVIVGALLERGHGVFHIGIGGDQKERQVGVLGANFA